MAYYVKFPDDTEGWCHVEGVTPLEGQVVRMVDVYDDTEDERGDLYVVDKVSHRMDAHDPNGFRSIPYVELIHYSE